jgi:glycosyltransferase involved in cell wall biosynthesis
MKPTAGASAEGISVVIPAFNAEAFLADTINSVLAQNWPTLEIVVVDDGSTDETQAIVKQYAEEHPGTFRYVWQQNSGPAKARNTGVLTASHSYVALLDHDDRWMPTKLARQMAAMKGAPWLAACATGIVYRVVGEAPIESVIADWDDGPAEVLHRLLVQNCILTSSLMARREALVTAGLFDTSLWWGDEYDLWLRLAARGFRIGYVAEALVDYTRGDSNLSSYFLHRGIDPYISVMHSRFDSGEFPKLIQRRRRWYIANRHLNNAVGYLESHPRLAMASLLSGVYTRPASFRPGWVKLFAQAARRAMLRRPLVVASDR